MFEPCGIKCKEERQDSVLLDPGILLLPVHAINAGPIPQGREKMKLTCFGHQPVPRTYSI